jgi:trk system potassium uptake protein
LAERNALRGKVGRRTDESVMVIGLGRFGGTLATTLMDLGNEVLGVDTDQRTVQEYSNVLTKAVEADTTQAETLRQLGAVEFRHVVVAIGDLEASILTTAELVALGVTDLWAKAITEAHAQILERVGVPVEHVVRPEHDMGERVAHRVTGKMLDYIQLDPGFALVETEAPSDLHGLALAEAGVRQKYGVTVVCIKPAGEGFTYAQADTVIAPGDILLVAGENKAVDGFALLE